MTPKYIARRIRAPQVIALREAERAFLDSLRVDRGVCFRCGTRSDVGCPHSSCLSRGEG
jgi:hypothetical protein